ncbi:helix-turn-helix domain-containing protein [Lutibacter holmesii]|uniref:Helix-turn-helix domain-containing protein n=1 Tax=Lutibacter holmesii TaxID=1137985 RepID=A0ABW3WNI7_9FLAO
MVNTEEFTKRIKIIIEHYNISAAILAEKMKVQRSSISHILSGRNKPSLDFVMKILNAFPEVELYWLLNGTGSFPKTKQEENTTPLPPPTIQHNTKATIKNDIQPNIAITKDSDIERIVIFYKDGSFKSYTS